jgi:N-methylhydantoinase A
MIIGIDVGGTNTDAVMLEDSVLLRKVKMPTDRMDLLSCVLRALENLLVDAGTAKAPERIVLSTTLSTNAIVENRAGHAAMIVSGGPGIDPALFSTGTHYYLAGGSIDHRGREVAPLDIARSREIIDLLKKEHVPALGAVTKFSTRNPAHEVELQRIAGDGFRFVSLGHRLSGSLNFPRRIATTFLNASVYGLHRAFVDSVKGALKEKGINAPLFILKADGGTLTIDNSVPLPVYTICSGPAASIMGLMALQGGGTFIGLDIGGTTTDISVFYEGDPLYQPHGINIGAHKTLIRGLLTRSIGVGGDSALTVAQGSLGVGPLRMGPPLALGGDVPALLDALNVSGFASLGDREKSGAGLEMIGRALGIPGNQVALHAVERACEIIREAASSMLDEINSRPVYTIHELKRGLTISPREVVAVGGPASALASSIERKFGFPVKTPLHGEVANAIGAALSRITSELTLHADTAQGRLYAIEADYRAPVKEDFRLEDLKREALALMEKGAASRGDTGRPDAYEFIEEQEFAMIRGFSRVGRNIRVKVQIKPGLISSLEGVKS